MEAFIAIWYIAGLVLVVVWTVLPFAIFGTKPILRELVTEAKTLNDALKTTNTRLANIEAYSRYLSEVTDETVKAKRAAIPPSRIAGGAAMPPP